VIYIDRAGEHFFQDARQVQTMLDAAVPEASTDGDKTIIPKLDLLYSQWTGELKVAPRLNVSRQVVCAYVHA
jgi:hypothetical protein